MKNKKPANAFIKRIPGTPTIRRNSVRPRLKYLSGERTYKLFLPKLPVFITEKPPHLEKVYYFTNTEDLPVYIIRTWFIGKKVLQLANRYPNTYMALNTMAETFPEATKTLEAKMKNCAKLHLQFEFRKVYIKYCQYKNIPYNRDFITKMYLKYEEKYGNLKPTI